MKLQAPESWPAGVYFGLGAVVGLLVAPTVRRTLRGGAEITVDSDAIRRHPTASLASGVEYAATHDAYLHYDNFSWQVGSVLVAGVFVFWGFAVSANLTQVPWFAANALVCAIMTIWLLYTEHNRQIYLFKLHRLHEIEKALEMWQHRRFREPKVYVLDQPVGHYLDDAVYAVVSLGGPVLAWATLGKWQSMLFIVFVAAVIWRVHAMDRRAKGIIRRLENPELRGIIEGLQRLERSARSD